MPNPSLNADAPVRVFSLASLGGGAPVTQDRQAATAADLSGHICAVKVSDVLRMLNDDGWYLVVTHGSHRQFKHATKSGRVTVPGKPSDELAPGTLNSIRKQAGLKK